MNKEEDIIRNLAGTTNNFKVPENYFSDFTKRMMEQIPAERKSFAMWKPIAACAACLVAIILSTAIFFVNDSDNETNGIAAAQTDKDAYNDTYVDEFIDYAMMDNADIVACLSEE